jgi:hypothetical protein
MTGTEARVQMRADYKTYKQGFADVSGRADDIRIPTRLGSFIGRLRYRLMHVHTDACTYPLQRTSCRVRCRVSRILLIMYERTHYEIAVDGFCSLMSH